MLKVEKTDLRRIPGVGKNMEEHLVRLGYTFALHAIIY